MKFAACIATCALLGLAGSALGDDSTPQRSPRNPPPASADLERDLLVGDWTMVGTAKDSPKGPEYKLTWKLHGRRVLGGAYVQVDQTWKGAGPESHSLEMVRYDPATRTHATFGFSDDGSFWIGKASFSDDGKVVESGTTTETDGTVMKWNATYLYSADRMSVTGTEEAEKDGVKWTTLTVKGTKSRGSPSKLGSPSR